MNLELGVTADINVTAPTDGARSFKHEYEIIVKSPQVCIFYSVDRGKATVYSLLFRV